MTTTTTTVSQAETLANRILDILEQQGVAVWGCYSEPDAAALPDPHAAEVVRGWAADLEALAESEAA